MPATNPPPAALSRQSRAEMVQDAFHAWAERVHLGPGEIDKLVQIVTASNLARDLRKESSVS